MKHRINDFIQHEKVILTDGPMETRIMFNTNIVLDADGSIFRLVFLQAEKKILENFYRQDLNIVSQYDQSIILNAPTFRASQARVTKFGFNTHATKQINRDCVQMVTDIRDEYAEFGHKILINGPVGPKNDAYHPEAALSAAQAREYHAPQIEGLIEGNADIIAGVTFPSAQEALGFAQCCADLNATYSVGFVLTHLGKLLDGTSVADLIEMIDTQVKHPPLYYMIICTHTSVVSQALSPYQSIYQRIYGIKANGSAKSPEELAKLDKPEADEPTVFAQHMLALHREFGFKILGGCCGTDSRHIEALCRALS